MNADSIATDRKRSCRWLILSFCLLAILSGGFQAWTDRHAMNPDGVAYLDIGDAFASGNWKAALSVYWSPLYPWLLGLVMLVVKPSPYWEFAVVHAVNFAIYLSALAAFHFFLVQFIRWCRTKPAGAGQREAGATRQSPSPPGDLAPRECLAPPEWAWYALGYSLFLWAALRMVTLNVVAPDMLVAAFAFAAAGVIVRIRTGEGTWAAFASLGVLLGLGYLAKAPMLPLAFVFLIVALFAVGDIRRAAPCLLVALGTLVLVAGPFILALSLSKGRLTWGDSARLHYAWNISGDRTSRYAAAKVFDRPPVHAFDPSIGGTYPPRFDPSHWCEGVTPQFNLRSQMRMLALNVPRLTGFLLKGSQAILLVAWLVLCFAAGGPLTGVKRLPARWFLLVPPVAAVGMYCLVALETRYIAPFVVVLWVALFSALPLHGSEKLRKMTAWTAVLIAVVMTGDSIGHVVARAVRHGDSRHTQSVVADCLSRAGLKPGDNVAVIGAPYKAYWARLARVHVGAEIPADSADGFWTADESTRSEVAKRFAEAGARVAVTDRFPGGRALPGWERIGETSYYCSWVAGHGGPATGRR